MTSMDYLRFASTESGFGLLLTSIRHQKYLCPLREYNRERPHESLNNLTPEEYRLLAENNEISKSVWN